MLLQQKSPPKSPKSPKSPTKSPGPSKSPIAKERPPTSPQRSSRRSTTTPYPKAANGYARGIEGIRTNGEGTGTTVGTGRDGAVAALDVRLQGRSLTRSKSERARLLLLAQDAMMATSHGEQAATSSDAHTEGSASTAPAACTSHPTAQAASTSPAFARLKRSAASELALCLEEDMTLS